MACDRQGGEKRPELSLFRTLFAVALASGLAAGPALADPPRDQNRVSEGVRSGRLMPLPKIEKRVMPFAPGADYLGPELNGETYRLKFMRNGRVFWIDVDPETGKIVGRSK